MNLLAILRRRVEGLTPGPYTLGLRAVLQHIDVAVAHWERGQQSGNDTAFTDAIYRTNQAFEGSLKEAFRVLADKDPAKQRPAEIETFLQKQKVLRPRVLDQVGRYRTEWRNPSTHDYRLDFDEDEALLAIVSIAALAIVLVDQIAEKASFDAARAVAQPTPSPAGEPLAEQIVKSLETFRFSVAGSSASPREVEIVGAVAGHLSASLPGVSFVSEAPIAEGRRERADLLATSNGERVIVEVKRGRKSREGINEAVAQLERFAEFSGVKDFILFLYSHNALSVASQRIDAEPGNITIRVLAPA